MVGDATAFSHPERLTELQRQLITSFLPRAPGFFLTGGAALVGFDFGHRQTDDLDFFSAPGTSLDEAERVLADVVAALGATSTPRSRHADFRRHLVRRGDETCVVDLVVDRAPMVDADKRRIGPLCIDTPRELTANKVAALVGRSELRDLVDLERLLASGQSLEQALADAQTKDAGVDAATLAWTVEQLHLAPTAKLPGDIRWADLDRFRQDLVLRLRALAFRATR
jgi:hypothetical protein